MSPTESACWICDKLFTGNKYSGSRQKVCQEAACRKEAKRRRQGLWVERNPDYFRGPEHVERVRQWRRANPDRARRRSSSGAKSKQKAKSCNTIFEPETALQDLDLAFKSPVLLGFASVLSGSVLQEEVHNLLCECLRRGGELLRPDAAASESPPNLNFA